MLKAKIDTNIFLVDHNLELTRAISNSIDNPDRYNIESFTSGEKFISHLSNYKFSRNEIYIVFLGYKYFDEGNNTLMNGVEILESTKAINKDIEVVMLTGEDEGSYGSYVMKSGAFAFIPKNENIHLRINNIIMGIISQKRLIQRRYSYNISLKILIGYILLVTAIWAIYRFFYYDF
ncbi:MAG: response regulator [Bacteroidales bacterium]|nr:MAG: response regulator [Bacteroidales bacterium]